MSPPPDSDTRYTVRRWSGLLALGSEVGLVLVVGVGFGLIQDRWAVNLVTIAVVLVLGALAFDRATLAFRADESGLTWSSRTPRVLLSTAGVRRLAWSSVSELEVEEGRCVRVRLRPGATLPTCMRGRTVDPADCDAQTLVEGEAPGVQEVRLRAVVERFARNIRICTFGETGPCR